MLGLLYLLLCFLIGYLICSYIFPKLEQVTLTAYSKRKISLSPYIFLMPIWFFIGTLVLTWAVYLIAYVSSGAKSPLAIANSIVIILAVTVTIIVLIIKYRKKKLNATFLCSDKKVIIWEALLICGIIILAIVLMCITFYVRDGKLNIGVSVFSDFSPHLGMIRSFSHGDNFPTSYSHFAGEDIKYHFMFQFLAGNLEYLGMRIDYAFNIPSIITFAGSFMLLYVLTVKITESNLAGGLACLFYAFRSSKTLFTYIAGIPEGIGIFESLSDNTEFISDTPNESWGLWNLNVYANQRHLALGLCVMFFVIIMFLPRLYEMFEAIKDRSFINSKNKIKYFSRAFSYIKLVFFTKDGWVIKDIRQAAALGIILGSLSFFHGAAVIGCLLVLFIMAAMSKRRLEYLFAALITILMSYIQTGFFISGNAVSPEFYYGFIAENRTVFGVLSYLERLLGILPFIILAYICVTKNINRYLVLPFIAPLVFAFTVSLTVDVTVNHKYIMMSVILLGIPAASLVAGMLKKKGFIIRMIGVLLISALILTGVYDFATVIKKNTIHHPIVLDINDPLTKWVDKNSTSKDIFLTASYSINNIVFGGAMLYQGHQYYAWSAGYDTVYRDKMVRQMYEADSPEKLIELTNENNIRFIVVEHENRVSSMYNLNENNIRNTFECVYDDGEGEWQISIFDTKNLCYEVISK